MSRDKTMAAAIVAAILSGISISSAQAPADDQRLEEVVVTAQFREQRLQDTPIAITAVTAEMMELRNQTSIYQVSAQAPSVLLAPQSQISGTGLLAFIRGVGQTDFNYALEPGVGMYIDDVYYATVTGSNFDLMDLERVEILRGPQGTLAGRNSIGGAIKMFSRKPTGEGGGSVALTYGDYNRVDVRATGDFSLIDDKLFARFAGVSKSRDGFIDRLDYRCVHPGSALNTLSIGTGCKLGTLGGQSLTAGRVSLRWLPTDAVEVNLIGDVTNDSSESGAAVLRRAINTQAVIGGVLQTVPSTDPRYIQQNGVPYDCRFVPYGPYSCDTGGPNDPYVTYATFLDSLAPTTQRPAKPFAVPPIQQLDQWGVAATVDWALSEDYALKWIGSYRRYDSSWGHDIDGSPLPSQQLLQTLEHRQITQEVRLNGSLLDDRLEFTLGGFYFDQEGTLQARVDLNYSGIDFIHGPDETPAKSTAGFGHVEFKLTDKFTLIGGLRFTKDEKDYVYRRRNPDLTVPTPCAGPPNLPTTNPNCVLSGLYNVSSSFESDRTDWRAGLNYRWNESLMTYAQVSTGYKGGGINPRPFFPHQILGFNPETMTTYEVGAKADLLDGRLRVNVAGFFNKYEDIILTLSICNVAPPLADRPCALPANVGAADVKGVEVEVNMRLGAGFSVDASASQLDFEYTDVGVATGVTKSMITPYTPEEKYSGGIMWEGDIGNRGSLLARADYAYQSEVHSAAINLPFTRVPSYGVYNARLTWRSPEAAWETSFELNNVTDKLYYTSNNDGSTSAGHTAFGPGMPRVWAVTLKRNF